MTENVDLPFFATFSISTPDFQKWAKITGGKTWADHNFINL